MSKIGKLPVEIPQDVKVDVEDGVVKVSGPRGKLERKFPKMVSVLTKDSKVIVESVGKSKQAKAMHGTTRAIISNMVAGVSEGWSKVLELVGTGYRAEGSGSRLTLTVGYSHPVEIEASEGITFKVEKTQVIVEGTDKELVGKIAAEIRAVRPPEPYKGKGIKYKDEVVRRKPGKAVKAQEVA